MSKLSMIQAAYIDEMKSVLKSSALLLQKEKNSLNGELKTSGKICEDFVRNLISTHIPRHLRVTSGYILDPIKKNSDENLPQFDLLLVDNSFSPIYKFNNLDIEVVPVEGVCAIFEIKRHIDKNNIKEFIKKLTASIASYSGLTKTAPYNGSIANPHNLSFGINAPLIGIISLTSDLALDNTVLNDISNVIDLLWAIDGFAAIPHRNKILNGIAQTNIADVLSRPKNDSFAKISKQDWKLYINDGCEYEYFFQILLDKEHPEKVLSPVIGWLTFILHKICGRNPSNITDMINQYYFSNT